MSQRLEIVVSDGQDAIARILESLAGAGLITVREPPAVQLPTTAACSICREVCAADALDFHAHLEGRVCPTCRDAADRIIRRFRVAAGRAWAEFLGQLHQMTRDVRSGADEPTFYRGFE